MSHLVRLLRQIIAALVLFAWLGAGTHMALSHGGLLHGSHLGEAMHEEGPAPADGAHHHHDLDAMTAARLAKSAVQQFPAPQTLALEQFVAESTAWLWVVRSECERPGVEDPPPDERASGWLLACRTAHPVRGPSLPA